MNRTWAGLGADYLRAAFAESGRVFDVERERSRVTRQIEQLTWRRPDRTLGAHQHHLIEVVSRHVSAVSAVAENGCLRCPERNGWIIHPLLGIEGMRRGQRVRLYVLDVGAVQFPLAVDEDVPHVPFTEQPARQYPQGGYSARAEAIAADFAGLGARLDDFVHHSAAATATHVNNSGLEEQVAYLLTQGEPEEEIRALLAKD